MLKDKLKELCGIDYRALGAFRISLGLILLVDLFIRFPEIDIFYTDNSILPRWDALRHFSNLYSFSFHFMNGTALFQQVLFFISFVFAFTLTIGYKSRLSTILSWILLISLHNRDPYILQGGDILFRMLMFWGMFLPLGCAFSIDRLLDHSKQQIPKQIVSVATLALLMQIALLYFFAVIFKSDPRWRVEGSAIFFALHYEIFTTHFGFALLKYPKFLEVLTFFVFYLEAFGPIFAFSPIWTGPLRMITAFVFMAFHLIGLNLAMELGPFPYVCAAGWVAFLPATFWDAFPPQPLITEFTQKAKDQLGKFSQQVRSKFPKSRLLCWLIQEEPVKVKSGWLMQGFAAFFLIFILQWNFLSIGYAVPGHNRLDWVGYISYVYQKWAMFSPTPPLVSGWYVIPAKLNDGTEVDLMRDGKPLTYRKPPLISATFKNERWRKFMTSLWSSQEIKKDDESAYLYENLSKVLCRKWNESHTPKKQIHSLEIDLFIEWPNPNPKTDPPYPKKTTVWTYQCDTL